MSDHAMALGTLLIEIADLAGTAEDHGITGNPPPDVLGPLIEQASQLGVDIPPQASLADLHLAVETAAQVIDDPAPSRATASPPAPFALAPPAADPKFALPLPQVSPDVKKGS